MKIKQMGGIFLCFSLCLFLSGCATTKNYQTTASTPPPASTASTTTPPPPIPGAQVPYQVYGEWYQPMADAIGFEEEGLASWYGEQFHGKKTSSGEIYNMHGFSAAHKTLPLGTTIEVTNMLNGKTVRLIVNDRGPFIRGRVLDLSYAAARELECVEQGVVPVKIVALANEFTTQNTNNFAKAIYTFQVGAFSNKEKAEQLQQQLAQTHENVHISSVTTSDGVLYRVRVGKCTDLTQIAQQEAALKKDGFAQAFLVTMTE